jgi:D-sedoheptulose 7-phosphate isomerase
MTKKPDDHVRTYLTDVAAIAAAIPQPGVQAIIDGLLELRSAGGRLFFLGVGGSAGNASHAVNDFRKIAGIESYAPTDNVSELTARINDDGWDSCYARWLEASRLGPRDALFIFSVGGGNAEKRISVNLVEAIDCAGKVGAKVFGVVGRDGGYTARKATACVIVPSFNSETVTAHAEAFQAVIWHLIVSHPQMRVHAMKWESTR